MKILSTNLFRVPTNSYSVVPYRKQETKKDIFVKSNNQMSFTGDLENKNPYKQVLENPTLTQKVIELITQASIILVGKAAGIVPRNNDNNIDIENIFGNHDKNSEEIEGVKSEVSLIKSKLEQLEQQNNDMQEQIKQCKNTNVLPEVKSNDSYESDSSEQENKSFDSAELKFEEQEEPELQKSKYVFEFPKKKVGKLSIPQSNLKRLALGLDLEEDSGRKLTKICSEFLCNGSHSVDGVIFDNKKLLVNFLNEFSPDKSGNVNTDEIINKYCKILGFADTHSAVDAYGLPVHDISPEPEDAKSAQVKKDKERLKFVTKSDSAEPEIYETERVILQAPKVLGKMELSKKDLNRDIYGKSASSKKSETKLPSAKKSQINKTSKKGKIDDDFIQTSKFELKDPKEKIFLFSTPGTPDKDLMVNLTRLLRYFEYQLQKEEYKPKYQCSQALGTNNHDRYKDILKELKKYHYDHIKKSNIKEVIKALDSDPRFAEMFNLHAAMRLIDRFADFDSEVSLEEQCPFILDQLFKVLQKSFKDGLEVQRYKNEQKSSGARLFISEKAYDKDAQSVFGVYPFGLGLCENQPDPEYYDKQNKRPLICTIFAKGMHEL